MTSEERKALDEFVVALRAHYRERLRDILVFGSRARGDHTAQSDLDLLVLLDDGDWRASREVMVMADMAYDALMSSGLVIQPFPVAITAWKSPQEQANREFLETVRRDARALRAAA